jgi:hypothetical protein
MSGLLLGLVVGAGVAAIMAIRSWWRREQTGRGDWESALAGYRDLRDRGVLSEAEYRKIGTLVEPYVRAMPMATSRGVPPVADKAESDHAAQPSEDVT